MRSLETKEKLQKALGAGETTKEDLLPLPPRLQKMGKVSPNQL